MPGVQRRRRLFLEVKVGHVVVVVAVEAKAVVKRTLERQELSSEK